MRSQLFSALTLLGLLFAAATVRAARSELEDEDEEEQMHYDEDSVAQGSNDMNDDVDDDYNPREQLMKHLFANKWLKLVPPPARYLPVQVQVKMRPLHIDYVCTKTYHIKMPVLESYNWTDPRLAWNESLFGGVKTLSVDASDIWMPDIGVYQSPEGFPTATRPKEFRPLIYSSGVVVYMPRTKYYIACAARTWLVSNNNTMSSSNSSGSSSSNMTTLSFNATTMPAGDSNNKTRTFACEFDQGPWSYDTSVVDIIPILGGGLATAKQEKKLLSLVEQQQLQSRSNKSTQQKLPQRQQQKKSSKRVATEKVVDIAREYTAKEYNATTDLSWFEPNELYNIVSFKVKRIVMQYPAAGTEPWSSMHYRLVLQLNNATNAVDLTGDSYATTKSTSTSAKSASTVTSPVPIVVAPSSA